MWEVWWSLPDPTTTAVHMDTFEQRLFAEGHGVKIQREKDGWVTIVHVVNGGTSEEYRTYWTLVDPSARNGAGSWRLIAMSPREESRRGSRTRSVSDDEFTPGAIEL